MFFVFSTQIVWVCRQAGALPRECHASSYVGNAIDVLYSYQRPNTHQTFRQSGTRRVACNFNPLTKASDLDRLHGDMAVRTFQENGVAGPYFEHDHVDETDNQLVTI